LDPKVAGRKERHEYPESGGQLAGDSGLSEEHLGPARTHLGNDSTRIHRPLSGQALGVVWGFAHPVIVILVYIFIFNYVFKLKLSGAATARSSTMFPRSLQTGEGPEECVVYRSGPLRIKSVELIDGRGRLTTAFKVGDSMTIRVWYACEGPPPDEPLALALAINPRGSTLCVNQFNTHCPSSDDDALHYQNVPFRLRPASACFGRAFRGADRPSPTQARRLLARAGPASLLP
jgi:hypothetical protein